MAENSCPNKEEIREMLARSIAETRKHGRGLAHWDRELMNIFYCVACNGPEDPTRGPCRYSVIKRCKNLDYAVRDAAGD